MKLIVGLGNPGREYANNRHNIGFMCLNHFARAHGIGFDRKQGLARIGTSEVAGIRVVLAKPQTYMNSSGDSASRLVRAYKISLEDLIVIHDDLDLPPGKVRIRLGGSAAGHKGVQSVIDALGNRDFVRVRVGIGRPEDADDAGIIDYVLSDFTPEERKLISDTLPAVSEAILSILTEGLAAAMNKFN